MALRLRDKPHTHTHTLAHTHTHAHLADSERDVPNVALISWAAFRHTGNTRTTDASSACRG
jgi:DNA polymerase II small subunit/DNA polymerase delta subunit B